MTPLSMLRVSDAASSDNHAQWIRTLSSIYFGHGTRVYMLGYKLRGTGISTTPGSLIADAPKWDDAEKASNQGEFRIPCLHLVKIRLLGLTR